MLPPITPLLCLRHEGEVRGEPGFSSEMSHELRYELYFVGGLHPPITPLLPRRG